MNNIQTAEEFLKNKVYITQDGIEDVHDSMLNVVEAMLEFTKLHVEAALKEAAEKADAKADKSYSLRVSRKNLFWTYGGSIGDVEIDKESILDAYPLDNIK